MSKKYKIFSRNFVCIWISNLLLFFGFEMLVTTVPIYIVQIGGNDSSAGFATMIFTVAAVFTRFIAGYLLDRLGRKYVFLFGLAAMAVITYVYGWIFSVSLILAVRLLHGLAWGITSTSSSTVASDIIPKERFGEGMGYYGLSNSLGMAVGPAAGLWILETFKFDFLFTFSAVTVILAASFFLLMKGVKGRKDIQLERQQTSSLNQSESLEIENVLKFKRSGGIIEKTALVPSVTILFASTTYGALVTFMALYGLQEGLANSGIYFAVYAIAMLITRPFAGRMTDRHGYFAVVIPGLMLMIVGLVILGFSHDLWQFLVSAVFYGSGIGAAQSALMAMAVGNAPVYRKGVANATFLIGFDSGIGIGSAISGIIAMQVGYGMMYICFSAFIVVAVILFSAVTMIHGKGSNSFE